MNGQWIGTFSGTNSGTLVADLDAIDSRYVGAIYVYDGNPRLPRTFAPVEIPKGKSAFSSRVGLEHLERGTGVLLKQADIAAKFPGVSAPTYADIDWTLAASEISVRWTTDVGTSGSGKMTKSEGHKPSALTPLSDVQSWEDFTKFVRTLDPYQFAFRGHASNQWKLRTSFHRTGRASLPTFITQDIASLQRHLSGLTTHRFDLSDPLDYAAFLNLVQHHGYPTPMLDWTQSPFVAAYFAFKDIRPENIRSNQKVRIVIFDSRAWAGSLERAPVLVPGFLHLTMLEPLAINNPRALPQQSLSSVTNVDDLEQYIQGIEKRAGKSYLRAIDLNASERRKVMQDLALMGITAGSMFPGLEGACLQLKERYFDL